METLRIRDTQILVSQSEIRLQDLKGGTVIVFPGEVDDAREIVGTIWKMTSLPAIPNQITSGQGRFIAFIEGKEVELRRVDDVSGNVGFHFKLNECDWIIDALDMGLNKLKDLFGLAPQPRGVSGFVPSGNYTTDIIDGRS